MTASAVFYFTLHQPSHWPEVFVFRSGLFLDSIVPTMVKGYKHMTKEEVEFVKDMHKHLGLGEISRITHRSRSTPSRIFAKRVVEKPKCRPV